MSTFDGIVREFPDIRIDHFRNTRVLSRPPLAYFLSHVHSDHLTGLESCKSPFIYCSPATREILLRLEKYPHRMNFAKGILETRKQTYRHLKNLLKAIPLETLTVLELSPGKTIRVTLFDANHCVGAVMFLVEGEGRAVLYTGDIRSEGWWVDSLTRHPLLVPYASLDGKKPLKRLDNVYLDTTFASKADPYREFPSKRNGLREMLEKVSMYPNGTRFYFDSWTFGYEDVWQALSSFLDSQVHLDDYRFGLYRALVNGLEPKAGEVSKLMGFHCGNHFQHGCLTNGPTRLHSCEKGTGCEIWEQDFVRITPIISRYQGKDMFELGAGGGQGDLDQQHELDVADAASVGQLITLCASKMQSQPQLLSGVLKMLTSVINGQVQSISLDNSGFSNDGMIGGEDDAHLANIDELPLDKLVPALAKIAADANQKQAQNKDPFMRSQKPSSLRADGLPKQITFPYSRHSSYAELCYLIEAFKPRDIHPCTVDEANWTASSSMSFMSFLFGHLYDDGRIFHHDQNMLKKLNTRQEDTLPHAKLASRPMSGSDDEGSRDVSEHERLRSSPQDREHHLFEVKSGSRMRGWDDLPPAKRRYRSLSGRSHSSAEHQTSVLHSDNTGRDSPVSTTLYRSIGQESADITVGPRANSRIAPHAFADTVDETTKQQDPDGKPSQHSVYREEQAHHDDGKTSVYDEHELVANGLVADFQSSPLTPEARLALRQEAHDAALGLDDLQWSDVGLVSTNGHQMKEEEL